VTVSRISGRLIFVVALVVCSAIHGRGEQQTSAVIVELSGQKPLTLRITVHSKAAAQVTLYSYKLPWGSRNSMILMPVNSDRECVGNKYFAIDDPSTERVTIGPNGTLSGELDLKTVLPDIQKSLKESDVHLFWAYQAPEELHIGRWVGGWLLIPRQKAN